MDKTISIGPHPDLYNRALRYAEVEGIVVYEDERGLQVNANGVYETKEAVSKLVNGIVVAFVKACTVANVHAGSDVALEILDAQREDT